MPTTSPDQRRAPLLTDKAGAARCGFSRATFWRRVNDGTLPLPIKIGGATRWLPEEIEAAIEAAKVARGLRGPQ